MGGRRPAGKPPGAEATRDGEESPRSTGLHSGEEEGEWEGGSGGDALTRSPEEALRGRAAGTGARAR